MAIVKVFDAGGIKKYNHNHDPATGRFTTGSGGSGNSGGSDGGSHSISDYIDRKHNEENVDNASDGGKPRFSGRGNPMDDRVGLRQEMQERLDNLRSRTDVDRNSDAYKDEERAWENRIKLLNEMPGKTGTKMSLKDYDELEGEIKAKIESLKNHPAKESNPDVWAQEFSQWQNRLKLLNDMKDAELGAGAVKYTNQQA